jgi:hypothetical protein
MSNLAYIISKFYHSLVLKLMTNRACINSSAIISVFSFNRGAAGRADGGRAVFSRPESFSIKIKSSFLLQIIVYQI